LIASDRFGFLISNFQFSSRYRATFSPRCNTLITSLAALSHCSVRLAPFPDSRRRRWPPRQKTKFRKLAPTDLFGMSVIPAGVKL
jgi:hypothetical protein